MKKLLSSILALALLAGCSTTGETEDKTITVGVSPQPHGMILEAVRDEIEAKGYKLVIEEFSDYVMPNVGLSEGSLDANYFQHVPYLEDYNANNGTDLVSAGAIHYEPFAIYAGKDHAVNTNLTVDDIPEKAIIGIPNDGSNEARALALLEAIGLIKIDKEAGLLATKNDIVENPKNVEILELEAKVLPAQLSELDYAVINGNYALGANIGNLACVFEDVNSIGLQTYANVIAVRKGEENSEKTKVLIEALTSEKAVQYIKDTFGDAVVSVVEK